MYGPVCTVVWQGSAGDRRPYADQVAFSYITNRLENRKHFSLRYRRFLGLTETLPCPKCFDRSDYFWLSE